MKAIAVLALSACASAPRARSTEDVQLAGDLVLRQEHDGTVLVLAVASLGGQTAAGTVRLPGVTVAEAQRSRFVAVARGRAWQVLTRTIADAPELAYEAAQRGVQETRRCGDDHWLAKHFNAETKRSLPDGLADALRQMQALLDLNLRACVGKRRHRGRVL